MRTDDDIVTGVLALVGSLIAIVGNSLVCLTIYRNLRLRTPTNVFIHALAIIGLLFAVLIGPSITVTCFAGRQWIFGQHFCNFQAFMILFTEFATLHTIALTAFNRFCRMTKPHLYKKIFPSKRRSTAILVLTWAIQLGFISAFSLPSFSKYEFSARRATCVLVFDSKSADLIYCVTKTAFYFGVTSVVVVYCYSKVFWNIREHARKVSNTFSRTRERVNVEEIKITRTVLGVVMFFLICWIPEYIISMIIRLHPNHLHPILDRIVVLFLFLSSSLTPWAYAVTNREFRAEFKRLLTCKTRQETEIVEMPEVVA
ncbi:melatonin receptor type 1C-like [Orbicella faveolata]|uniref:melatonin receptor type 1C-like n=1 Tax=Orbicella faveolata TaxID=48498 RepID=UPI0009E5C69C|nr:melatonin receptor type 1C-like [Orbicella faveolata]